MGLRFLNDDNSIFLDVSFSQLQKHLYSFPYSFEDKKDEIYKKIEDSFIENPLCLNEIGRVFKAENCFLRGPKKQLNPNIVVDDNFNPIKNDNFLCLSYPGYNLRIKNMKHKTAQIADLLGMLIYETNFFESFSVSSVKMNMYSDCVGVKIFTYLSNEHVSYSTLQTVVKNWLKNYNITSEEIDVTNILKYDGVHLAFELSAFDIVKNKSKIPENKFPLLRSYKDHYGIFYGKDKDKRLYVLGVNNSPYSYPFTIKPLSDRYNNYNFIDYLKIFDRFILDKRKNRLVFCGFYREKGINENSIFKSFDAVEESLDKLCLLQELKVEESPFVHMKINNNAFIFKKYTINPKIFKSTLAESCEILKDMWNDVWKENVWNLTFPTKAKIIKEGNIVKIGIIAKII